jgi:hypothetical protein
METVFSEVSIYCWRTKVSKIDSGKKRCNKFVASEGQVIQPPIKIAGQVETEISSPISFCIFLTTTTTR